MQDFLSIEKQFSSEEIQLRDSVRHFVTQNLMPFIAEDFENGHFRQSLIQQVADLGLLGMTLPEQYGGSAASYTAYGLVCEELERGDSGLRSFVSVQNSLCMFPIFQFGSEEQKKYFLPKMAKGEKIGCFGLTEPDVGSDPSSMKTQAKKVKGGYVLNGSKMWITNAPIADLAIVWAKTEEGVRGFIIEKENPGLQRLEIKHKASLRASSTGELVMQDCFVEDKHLLPGSIKGLAAPLACLTQARYGIAWGVMGAAEFCLQTAIDYTKQRVQFGKPVASFQLVQAELADMFTEICKGKLLNAQVAKLKEAGLADFNHISLIKRNNCSKALQIARMARELLGANGISLDYHVIRHMNNLESVYTYEGTHQIHTLVLGKYLTDIAAFE